MWMLSFKNTITKIRSRAYFPNAYKSDNCIQNVIGVI